MVPFSALDDLHAMDISDHHHPHPHARDVNIEEPSYHQHHGFTRDYNSVSRSLTRLDTRHHLDGRNFASSSSDTYRDIPPPPQYVHAEPQQSQQQALEDNSGNKTWAQIWADIERGTSASPVRQQSRGVPWHTQTETDGFQGGHFGGSNTTQDRGVFTLLRRALPSSLLGGGAAATATLTTADAPYLVSSSIQQQVQPIPSSLASLHQSDKTISEYKESMSSTLYKSTPIRLLALTILFFNTLLVIKVMADPMTPFNSGHYGMNNGGGNGQIRLGNSPAAGLSLEERFPCVAATSHNDEMQAAPFSEAISLGFTSIEVDTWLQNGTLLAGHELKDLSKGKTLKGIYLDPLFKMLERANEKSERLTDGESEDWKGVFPLAPKQEMMLMIDVKNDPEGIFNRLMRLLQPFIEKNYVTVFKDGKLIPGPLTIVGTGDTSISQVVKQSPRYIFYDAPLVRLQYPITIEDGEEDEDGKKINKTIEWSNEIAPIASSKWLWWNYYPDVKALKLFSDEAHKRGIKARWWGVARWPAYFRRALWGLQLRAEVDWLNADDLADVAAFLRSKEEERALKLASETKSRGQGASRIEDEQFETERT